MHYEDWRRLKSPTETAEAANERAQLIEALRPFAVYANYMGKRWSHRDDSSHYGTKRGPQVTYGDWRRAAALIRKIEGK